MFINPTYKIENKLFRQGFRNIAGLDEAGRGAWAGPIVASAVILPPKLKIIGLRDSKLLSPGRREALYVNIKKNAVGIGIGIVSEKIIDNQGIISATRQAFLQAIDGLVGQADYLLIDGIKIFDHNLPYEFFVNGDKKIMSISAASIIAKFTRDNILNEYHKQYPEYSFDKHKGYGTKLHQEKILQHGVCAIHRISFKPITYIDSKCSTKNR